MAIGTNNYKLFVFQTRPQYTFFL